MQQHEEEDGEYLFELAPLGPGDLLARCREGPGNWWGEGSEDLRVDATGRVVLVDPEMYYEVCKTTSREGEMRNNERCSDKVNREASPAGGCLILGVFAPMKG